MIRKLYWLVRKEYLQIVRTPVLVVMLVLCPLALAGIVPLGLGFEADIPTSFVTPDTLEEAEKEMDAGRIGAIVVQPDNGGEPSILIDGSHPVQAFEAAYSTVRTLYDTDELTGMVADVHLLYAGGRGCTRYYLVTMLLFLLALVGCCLPMLSVVWELESRRFELLRSTGTHAATYLSAKLLFCLLTALVELLAGLLVARLMHGLTCTGSFVALLLLTTCFIAAVGNLGVLLAAYGKTQLRSIYLFVFVFIFLVLLSTMFAPLDNMSPAWAATRFANPLFWMVDGAWKVLLKGAGLSDILPNCAALLAIGVLLAACNVRRLGKVR